MVHVNDHFGWAKKFAVYEIDTETYKLVETREFEESEGHEENRLVPKIERLKECAIVYLKDIGGPAAARLVQKRIHPITTREVEPINEILEKFQSVLKNSPPPWLKKIMNERREECKGT
jgi:nitrogen fixation protein NifX